MAGSVVVCDHGSFYRIGAATASIRFLAPSRIKFGDELSPRVASQREQPSLRTMGKDRAGVAVAHL